MKHAVTAGKFLLFSLFLFAGHPSYVGAAVESLSGRQIMTTVQERHHRAPAVYEEQTMILTDRLGNRDTRELRRYAKRDEDGNYNILLLCDTPAEIRGTALLVSREAGQNPDVSLYMPARGEDVLRGYVTDSKDRLLGTDLTFEDLTGEELMEYHYVRRDDIKLEYVPYFQVDVYDHRDTSFRSPLRRHFVRQDSFFITRTDYLDRQGRIYRQQRFYDLRHTDSDIWYAGMVFMHNRKEQHSTLIKINNRIYSEDYVSDEVFTMAWLYANQIPLPDSPTQNATKDMIMGPDSHRSEDQRPVSLSDIKYRQDMP